MAVGAYTVALVQNMFSDREIDRPVDDRRSSLLAGVVAAVVAGARHRPRRGPAARAVPGRRHARGGASWCRRSRPPSTACSTATRACRCRCEPPPEALGLDFPYEQWQAWLADRPALLVLLLLANLVRSRFGRDLRAVRDDEVAARLAGIHVARTQVLAFVVSAACAGLGGGVLAVLAQSVVARRVLADPVAVPAAWPS